MDADLDDAILLSLYFVFCILRTHLLKLCKCIDGWELSEAFGAFGIASIVSWAFEAFFA